MDQLCFLCGVFLMLLCLFIAALWSADGKGLTSRPMLVMFIVFLLLSHVVSWLGVVLDVVSYISYELQCCTLPDKRCLFHDMCLYQVMIVAKNPLYYFFILYVHQHIERNKLSPFYTFNFLLDITPF